MKILVTGAGGFIGSHLTELSVERGLDVRAFVHYNSDNRWGWLDSSSRARDVEVVAGDIRDFDSVFKAVKGCQAVFHLAALIGIPYSYVSPLAYLKTNVEGTYNVLEAAKSLNCSSVLVTSTSETYGTARYVPIDEGHPNVGQSPYAASKIAADQLAVSYFLAFGLPVRIVRPFNTFGPRQSARAIIPTIISQVLSGCREIRLGNLGPTRDLTFVQDTARGFLDIFCADSLDGEVTNLGRGEEISIRDLARKIADLIGAGCEIVADPERVRPEGSEVERLLADTTKIRSRTGWKPEYDLDRGLAETIAWFRDHLAAYKPGLYNV